MNCLAALLVLCYTHPTHGGPLLSRGKSASNQSLIIGGEAANIHDYPSTALLRIGLSLLYRADICGATILNHFALLTAANCLSKLRMLSGSFFRYFESQSVTLRAFAVPDDGRNTSPETSEKLPDYPPRESHKLDTIHITIGSAYADRGLDYYTMNYTLHPRYKHPEPNYNIGIVRTLKQMYLDGVVTEAITLSRPGTILSENTVVSLLGWGPTGTIVPAPSKVLRVVDVLVIASSVCAGKHAGVNLTMTFCVTETKLGITSTTDRDAGGPALSKNGVHQFGIILPTSYYGNYGEPTICADVASHRTWIDKVSKVH